MAEGSEMTAMECRNGCGVRDDSDGIEKWLRGQRRQRWNEEMLEGSKNKQWK
jgi:hypothetical protein